MATKPSISQYDRSFEGLRQSSYQNYVLLRTWILSLNEGGGVIDITYADLVAAIAGSTLIPGSIYCITDFRTREAIPNTADIHTGAVEPICVEAVSTDTLGPLAVSLNFPNDELVYEFDNTDFGADMGRITFRRDTINNLSAWYDWREFQFRRWENPITTQFTVTTDNGQASQDSTTFGADCANCHIGQFTQFGSPTLSNNVLGDECFGIEIEDFAFDNTIVSECSNVLIGQGSHLIVIAENCGRITIGKNVSTVTINAAQDGIEIGDDSTAISLTTCDYVTIGKSCSTISLSRAAGVKIGNTCSLITTTVTTETITNITIGNGCTAIGLNGANGNAGNIENMYFGDGCDTIAINGAAIGCSFEAGSNNWTIEFLNDACRAKVSPHYAEFLLDYDFAREGGAQGTFDFVTVPNGWHTYDASTQCRTSLAGVGASGSLGVETDAAAGIIAATPVGQPVWTAPNLVTASTGNQPTNGTTASGRAVQFEITGADLTAGSFVAFLRCAIRDV